MYMSNQIELLLLYTLTFGNGLHILSNYYNNSAIIWAGIADLLILHKGSPVRLQQLEMQALKILLSCLALINSSISFQPRHLTI